MSVGDAPGERAVRAHYADGHAKGCSPACAVEIGNIKIEIEAAVEAARAPLLAEMDRLYQQANNYRDDLSKAHDEIDRLRAENEELREALRPFADCDHFLRVRALLARHDAEGKDNDE